MSKQDKCPACGETDEECICWTLATDEEVAVFTWDPPSIPYPIDAIGEYLEATRPSFLKHLSAPSKLQPDATNPRIIRREEMRVHENEQTDRWHYRVVMYTARVGSPRFFHAHRDVTEWVSRLVFSPWNQAEITWEPCHCPKAQKQLICPICGETEQHCASGQVTSEEGEKPC